MFSQNSLMNRSNSRSLEVCLSPVLFPFRKARNGALVAVVDILRATTSMVTAFDFGVEHLIPLSGTGEARQFKNRGFLVAAEQDGLKPDFADFGNGAFAFMTPQIKGKTIGYSTTNGTKAIKAAMDGNNTIVIGAFINFDSLIKKIQNSKQDVVVLCSGWKNDFCMEDTAFAGALAEVLLSDGTFIPSGDAVMMSVDMWKQAKDNLTAFLNRTSHMQRLKMLGQDDVLDYTISFNKVGALPVYDTQKGWLYNDITE